MTVIESDKALAARWFRSSPGDISAASALEAKMASEIAAAREASIRQHAWVPDPHRCLDCGGQPEAPQHAADLWRRLQDSTDAVAALVEAAGLALDSAEGYANSVCQEFCVGHGKSCPTKDPHLKSLRAALERVREGGSARE